MCQEPTELHLISCLTESIFDVKIQNQKSWHQEPTRRHSHKRLFLRTWVEQFALFVEHHESNHVLSQPCQSFCVSDPSRNPKPTSKEGQEQNFGEGSAMAEPKPMSPVQAKARLRSSLVCQVSHGPSLWSGKSARQQHWDNPEVPAKALTTYVWCWQKLLRNRLSMIVTQAIISSILKWENRKMFRAQKPGKQAKVTPSDGGFQRRLSTTAKPDRHKTRNFCNMSDYRFRFTLRRSSDSYRKSWEFKKDTNPSVNQCFEDQHHDVGIDSCLRRWG